MDPTDPTGPTDPLDTETQVDRPTRTRGEGAPPVGRDADPLVGMEVLGCRLLAPVGSGASGTVFRARQLRLDRDVAVKLVPVGDAGVTTTERFRREVRAIGALDHPHVVPVHDAGEADGLLVLVMKLVDGVDLRALVAARGPVEPGAAVAVVAQVAGALDAAHAAGLVHRDVKPANVLLSRGADRRAYLADFGLARALVAEETVTGESTWVGTPAYASPEQRAGAQVGPASDRYSLAGVLAFLVTGAAPGGAVDREAMTPAVRAVLEVAERGMATAPGDRFASATELADAARDAADAAEGDHRQAGGAAGTASGTALPAVDGDPRGSTVSAPGQGPRSTGRGADDREQRRLTVALVLAIVLVVLGGAAAAYAVLTTDDDPSAAATAPVGPADPDTGRSTSPSSGTSDSSGSDGALVEGEFPRLEPGDSGVGVRAAQLLLQARGLEVSLTGVLDEQTVAALRLLTLDATGTASGTLDDATWQQVTLTQAQGRIGEGARAVQELLVAAGVPTEVDGRYGEATALAVERFQASELLETDGVVGDQTWQALLAAATGAD